MKFLQERPEPAFRWLVGQRRERRWGIEVWRCLNVDHAQPGAVEQLIALWRLRAGFQASSQLL
jgi:hypothetical protein